MLKVLMYVPLPKRCGGGPECPEKNPDSQSENPNHIGLLELKINLPGIEPLPSNVGDAKSECAGSNQFEVLADNDDCEDRQRKKQQ